MTDYSSGALRIAFALVTSLLCVGAARAQVHGVSYTLSPVAEQIFFGENAGLERGFAYGGETGFGFGRLVELELQYLRNNGLATDFGNVSGIPDEKREELRGLPSRDVQLQRYGGKLKLNMPTENVVPFALLGAGIMRIQPEHLNPTRTIYLGAGGGVQFAVGGRYALTFSAERFGYRYNLGATYFDDLDLADVGLGPGSFHQTQVFNWALRGGLRIYVGGRAPGEETEIDRALREQFTGGLRSLSLRVEPFAGAIAFHEDLAFRSNQRFGGLFAGLNLGPYVGVRGFYWRGLESVGFDFDALQAYGGDMRFELAAGRSLTPYFTVGGGYLDVLDGYVGRDGDEPGDEPFVLVGAGGILPISESLSLNAGVRSVLMGEEGSHNVDSPGQVRSSWMYSAGLNVAFGGRRTSSLLREELERGSTAEARLYDELRRSEARLDSLARVIQRMQGAPSQAGAPAEPADTSLVSPPRSEPRMVTLPLPEEGELYVRFGRPGGVSIESFTGDGDLIDEAAPISQNLTSRQIEQIVRQTVREQLSETQGDVVTSEELDRLEDLLRSRLDALEVRLQNRLDGELARLDARTERSTIFVTDPSTGQVSRADATVRRAASRDLKPFTGVMFGTPNMGVIGFRLDMDTPFLGPINLQPEFALGLGSATYAYHVSLDAVYSLPFVDRIVRGFRPYVGLGAGMLGFNEKPSDAPGVQMTFNSRLGADFTVPWGRLFAEFATFDLLEYNRLAAGYRFSL